MAHKKNTRSKRVKQYKHLTVFDRAVIDQKRREGLRPPAIARLIKRDRSTIIRELERNSPPNTRRYRAEGAHAKALARRAGRGVRPRLKNELTRKYVIEKLKLGWSPEQISIRLPIDHPGQTISPEAIYQFVYAQVRRNGNGQVKKGGEDLRSYLPRRHTRRQKKGFRQAQKAEKLVLPSIEDRPVTVERRKQFGHWEDDTLVSRQSADRVKSINERVSGVVLLGKMKDGSITESNRVVIERLSSLPATLCQTLTRDRGTENLGYADLEKELGLTCYFAHAYCSQERGSNENLNGLVRRVYPKKNEWRFVPEEFEVSQGDTIKMTAINEDDYDHGIAIEAVGVSQKMPANSTVIFTFKVTKAGDYPFYCSVPCGAGEVNGAHRAHEDMLGVIHARSLVNMQ